MPRLAQMRAVTSEEPLNLLQRAYIDFCRDVASEPRSFGSVSQPLRRAQDHVLTPPMQDGECLPERPRKRVLPSRSRQ